MFADEAGNNVIKYIYILIIDLFLVLILYFRVHLPLSVRNRKATLQRNAMYCSVLGPDKAKQQIQNHKNLIHLAADLLFNYR